MAISVDLATDLAAEILNGNGRVCAVARGASMLPAIFPGDTLEIRKRDFEQIRVGDVVLSTNKGRLCTHRVAREEIRSGRRVLITRGDALLSDDEQLVGQGEFLGCVEFVVRRGRCSRPTINDNRLQSVFCVVLRRSNHAKSFLVRLNTLVNLLANNFAARPLTIDKIVARHS